MKKILIILLLPFLIFTAEAASPTPTLASCCPDGMRPGTCGQVFGTGGVTMCYPIPYNPVTGQPLNGVACPFIPGIGDGKPFTCGNGEKCDPVADSCIKEDDIHASCPPGQGTLLSENPAAIVRLSTCTPAERSEINSYCCTTALCIGASPSIDSFVNPLTCAQVISELRTSTAAYKKNYCNPYLGQTYDPFTGACKQEASSGFALTTKQRTCPTGGEGIPTAIGCVPTSDLALTGKFIFNWVFAAAGGIILLMSIVTIYTLMTSSGDPKKVEAVKENLTAILSGLILIVFSLILLKTVGADIIGIPGLF